MSRDPETPSLLERILAYATLTIIAAAIVCFFVTLIVGMNDREVLAEGLWPAVVWITYVGLPIGLVLLIALLLVSMRRRSKQNAPKRASGQRRR